MGGCYGWLLCLLDADWGLQSDVATNSRLFRAGYSTHAFGKCKSLQELDCKSLIASCRAFSVSFLSPTSSTPWSTPGRVDTFFFFLVHMLAMRALSSSTSAGILPWPVHL